MSIKTEFNEKRSLNYKKLREHGFHYLDATKYKDYTDDKINDLISNLPFPVLSEVTFNDQFKGRVVCYKNGKVVVTLDEHGVLSVPISKAIEYLKLVQ